MSSLPTPLSGTRVSEASAPEAIAETAGLAPQTTQQAAGSIDIAVGILSYNSAATIHEAVSASEDALVNYFPGKNCVLLNADGGSKDGTQALASDAARGKKNFVALTYPVYPVQKLTPEYYGVPGKANALQALFSAAMERGVKTCAVIDAGVRNLTPAWVEALVRPIAEEGFDFVSPCYARNKYEGTINSGIVYPLTRALYGRRIQHPAGGEFAVSHKLLSHLVRQPPFNGGAARFSATGSIVDIWITIQAASGTFSIAQASLGPRILDQTEPAPEVSTMLAQVLGSVFAEMDRTAPVWQRIKGSRPSPSFGAAGEPMAEPAPVDTTPMVQSFRIGYRNLHDIWRLVLPPAALMALKRLSLQEPGAFQFDDAFWARIVYDFALAWRMRVMDRDHLLRALTPLYLGWVAAYIHSVREANPEQAQDRVEAVCLAYEGQKNYLIFPVAMAGQV